MSRERFEDDLAALFDAPPALADEDAFAGRVAVRIDRIRRTQRWVFGTAYVLGGGIAALEILSWRGWGALGRLAESSLSPLTDPRLLASVTPTTAWLAAGAAGLAAYVAMQLRQSR